jgi:hypothetical protein
MGREPTPRERWRLGREAAVDSRPAKDHAVDAEALHARWAGQVRELGFDPEWLVAGVIGRNLEAQRDLDGVDPDGWVDAAIEALTDKQSSWRPAEIVRELAALTPTTLGGTAQEVVNAVDLLGYGIGAERGVELGPRPPFGVERCKSDGRPITEASSDRAITQRWIFEEERFLLDWAANRIDVSQAGSSSGVLDRCPAELSIAQRDAAVAIAGTADIVLVVGPAGTGKTTALRPAVEQLWADDRVVVGVAPSAIAASVLAEGTGVWADTIDKLLIEYRAGQPQPRFDLPAGTTVIVDEAGMLATPKLAELARLAQQRLHVGDEIATRRNDRAIETDRHEMVRNRDTWTITELGEGGTITAIGSTGTVTLPAGYVNEHVELAYAVTAMGAQGRTVDHAITVIDGPTDVRNLYVPMTRGRDTNTAFVATGGNDDSAVERFAHYIGNDWIDLPAHQRSQNSAHPLWANPTGRFRSAHSMTSESTCSCCRQAHRFRRCARGRAQGSQGYRRWRGEPGRNCLRGVERIEPHAAPA